VHVAAAIARVAAADSYGAGPPLSVAVLQPKFVLDQQPQSIAVDRRLRMVGSSWIISSSPAPLMLLPAQDVAAEAAKSFPTLLGPDGFSCEREDGSGSLFSGVFVGCAVVMEDCVFPSPWPLHINSSKCFCSVQLQVLAADATQCGALTCNGATFCSEEHGMSLVVGSAAAAAAAAAAVAACSKVASLDRLLGGAETQTSAA
jgi:hypothetical protein